MINGHSIEGIRIRCGNFYGMVYNGKCMECGKRIKPEDLFDLDPAPNQGMQ